MGAMQRDFELHEWFAPDELDHCPLCGERARVRLPATGSVVCIACGEMTSGPAVDEQLPEREQQAG
jgi:ribosomal protein L37AE/L43A